MRFENFCFASVLELVYKLKLFAYILHCGDELVTFLHKMATLSSIEMHLEEQT